MPNQHCELKFICLKYVVSVKTRSKYFVAFSSQQVTWSHFKDRTCKARPEKLKAWGQPVLNLKSLTLALAQQIEAFSSPNSVFITL